MGLFSGCKHEWYVVAKTFMPPAPEGENGWDMVDSTIAERSRAGVTTVLMACDVCGKTSVTEMLGREEKAAIP